MKKLMMAVAAIAMAVCAQAASVQWSFAEQALNSKNPMDLSSYTAYLFTADAWNAVLASDTGNGISKDAFTGYTDTAEITSSVIGGGKGVAYQTGKVISTGATDNYYIILSDLETGYVQSSMYAMTAFQAETEQHDSGIWSIGATAAPITTVTGSFENVPEPTSGLLLLLGMAGLALRRRRA